MTNLANAVEDQQMNMISVMDKLGPMGDVPNFVRASLQPGYPSPVRHDAKNGAGTNGRVIEEIHAQLALLTEEQRKLMGKFATHENNQIGLADMKDDWERISREQRIHTDHLGRLSQAVMELKTSKRSDALAAAAQIREQAETRMSEITGELDVVRAERAKEKKQMDLRLAEMESKFTNVIGHMKKEWKHDLGQLQSQMNSSLVKIQKELDQTTRIVREELEGTSFELGPGPLPRASPKKVSSRSISSSLRVDSPLRDASDRTLALDEELRILEEKIKSAQSSMLKGF